MAPRWKTDINRTDSTGRRQGFWIDDDGYVEAYYKNGALNGIYRSYSTRTGTLLSFGNFTNGEKTGKWLYFDDHGKLIKHIEYK